MTQPDKDPVANVVLADPPWNYDFSRSDSRKVENHYATMKIADICAMGPHIPVKPHALLLLWATAPKIEQAFEVMRAWGFTYKTQAIWNKEKIGMGYWFRGMHEVLMVGTRGKFSPPAISCRLASIQPEPRTVHSRKPEWVYAWVESAWPSLCKLELFARKKRPGWLSWGHGVEDDVEIYTGLGEGDNPWETVKVED